MAERSWVLTDVDADVHVDELLLDSSNVEGLHPGESIRKRTLRGGLRDGVNVVELDNGQLRLTVVPDRGMGLWRGTCRGVELGWGSPIKGPVNPRFVSLDEDNGIGWLRGFDEWLCRCGLESNGAPEPGPDGHWLHTLHGRIANLPAHRVHLAVDEATGEIALTGVVDEARLFGPKLRLESTLRMRRGASRFTIHDTVTNRSASPGDFQLLYHVNFGPPLVTPGAHMVAPVKTLVPRDPHSATDITTWDRYGAEQAGAIEFAHYFELAADDHNRTEVMLANSGGDQGVSLAFHVDQLPRFILWKNHQPAADGYVTGLEPAVNFPNARSYEAAQGRVVPLAPGASYSTSLDFEIHADAAAVARGRERIARLSEGVQPKIHSSPQPGWSPAGDEA